MKTKFLLLASVISLSACGFQPMYGTTRFGEQSPNQIAIESELAQIQIGNIPDREGQYLRNLLIDRFYLDSRPQNPKYILRVTPVKEQISDLDITKESDTTRAQLRMTTSIILTDKTTGQELLSQSLVAIGSYNILTSEFATRISEDNTRQNVLADLAAQIQRHTALYFKNQQ